MSSESEICKLSSAVAPNIFDVLYDSDHIASLCLSNLMSSGLWDLKERMREKLAQQPGNDRLDVPASIRIIQEFINKRFTHLHPADVAEIYGMVDLDLERLRFPQGDLDRMITGLQGFFSGLSRSDLHLDEVRRQVLCWIQQGLFPNYYYSSFDLIEAHRNISGEMKRSPKGLTSCLDETALFIALSLILPQEGEIRGIMIMSSISHYGAFGYSEDGRRWWFNGKNQLYSKADWDLRVQASGGDHQACFDGLFSNFSRMTTVSGNADLASGVSHIPEEHLTEYLAEMEAFFGIRLRQIERLCDDPEILPVHEGERADFLRGLIGLDSRETLLRRMDGFDASWVLKAKYCFRSLDVVDKTPYFLAARRNPEARRVAQSAQSHESLFSIVRSIRGSASIFGSDDRIAMPDETLRFDTGSHRDKGLLLHVLLEHYETVIGIKSPLETVFFAHDTWVGFRGEWISVSDFSIFREFPSEKVLFRLSGTA